MINLIFCLNIQIILIINLIFSILSSFAVYFHEILLSISLSWAKKKEFLIRYSAFHRNSPFARFIKLDVALVWLNIKFSPMAHMKQLTANFHVTIQKSQKSQGY